MKSVAVALAFAAMLLSGGCKEDPVVLATLAPTDGPPGEARCGGDDCAPGTFCEKPTCGAPAGTCFPFPTVCPPNEEPICGCDGVTYFNDCLRRASGASAAHPGECELEALVCHGPDECPSGAVCSLLTGSDERECERDLRGRCWVLPLECPDPSKPDRWQLCVPPPPPGPEPPPPPPPPPACVDTCSAIRTGMPHTRALRCE